MAVIYFGVHWHDTVDAAWPGSDSVVTTRQSVRLAVLRPPRHPFEDQQDRHALGSPIPLWSHESPRDL